MVDPKTTVWAKMPGHQELAVVHAVDRDRAAEHVREQQHEHDRRQGREDQQVGDPLDLDEVALGDDRAVAEGLGQRRSSAHLPARGRSRRRLGSSAA